MTVAIAWERYVAVHYPLDYNQAMNDSHAVRKRLAKYVGPVTGGKVTPLRSHVDVVVVVVVFDK